MKHVVDETEVMLAPAYFGAGAYSLLIVVGLFYACSIKCKSLSMLNCARISVVIVGLSLSLQLGLTLIAI